MNSFQLERAKRRLRAQQSPWPEIRLRVVSAIAYVLGILHGLALGVLWHTGVNGRTVHIAIACFACMAVSVYTDAKRVGL